MNWIDWLIGIRFVWTGKCTLSRKVTTKKELESHIAKQSINQWFKVMFHASAGRTFTRTSRSHDWRSGTIDGSKFNLFRSFSKHCSKSLYLALCQHYQTPHIQWNVYTQSIASFRCTCPYQRNLLFITVDDMLSMQSRLYNPLLDTLYRRVTPHILRIIVSSALSNLLRSTFFVCQVWLP